MCQLGGHALYLNWTDLQLGRGETVADTARTISRYIDGIVARVNTHHTLIELAEYATVPVINGLSDLNHPLQTLADLMTILEKKGKFEGLKLCYVGDGNNVCNSLLIGCSKVGLDMVVSCPEGYEPNPEFLEDARRNCEASGSNVKLERNPRKAAADADIIYTDVIVSMGQETDREKKIKIFLPDYQVNSEIIKAAKDNVIFMHPLPCRRGEEVTGPVIDGPVSVVWDQAENRLHTTKAILSLIL